MSVGWKLAPAERERLLALIPPRWSIPIADHVTLRSAEPLPPPAELAIVGEVDDDDGVQALVVTVDGTTERPGGGTYHITWSMEPGRKAVESNAVITRRGWTPLARPVPFAATPARWTWIDPVA